MTIIDDQMNLASRLARSGEKDRAQFLFAQIVEIQPDQVQAWLWLSELSSSIEDQTEMLDQALKYLPEGADGCKDLQSALNEIHGFIPLPAPSVSSCENAAPYQSQQKKPNEDEVYQQAERLAIIGKRAEALGMIKALTAAGANQERTWLLYSELSASLADKIEALHQVVAINPRNKMAAYRLDQFQRTIDSPLVAARYLEECGEMEQALALYHFIAAQSVSINEQAKARECLSRLEAVPTSAPFSGGIHRMVKKLLSFRPSQTSQAR